MKSAEVYTHEQGWDFEKAAMPYVDSLYNTAYRMTRNSEDAEDLVQETYLKAYKYYDKFEEGTNFKAWLFKIMKNTFINNYRKAQAQPPRATSPTSRTRSSQISEDASRQIRNPEEELLENVLDEDVQRAVDRCPDYRMVVLLADLEGFSTRRSATSRDPGGHRDEPALPRPPPARGRDAALRPRARLPPRWRADQDAQPGRNRDPERGISRRKAFIDNGLDWTPRWATAGSHMDCRHFRQAVYLVDDDSGQELLLSFRAQCADCPQCAREAEFKRRLLELVRRRCCRQAAPPALRARILMQVLVLRRGGEEA
jgi:RNA polymerase sigma-70 factor (ECF subfamily)